MQICLEVIRHRLGKKARRVKMRHMRLRFGSDGAAAISKQHAAAVSKGVWMQRIGMAPRIMQPDGTLLSPQQPDTDTDEREQLANGKQSRNRIQPSPRRRKGGRGNAGSDG